MYLYQLSIWNDTRIYLQEYLVDLSKCKISKNGVASKLCKLEDFVGELEFYEGEVFLINPKDFYKIIMNLDDYKDSEIENPIISLLKNLDIINESSHIGWSQGCIFICSK